MAKQKRLHLRRPKEALKTGIALSAGALVRARRSPDEAYGELFTEVQQRNVLGDGKTFVDLVPRKRARAIRQEYLLAKQDPDFDLNEFIHRHFYEFAPHKDRDAYVPESTISAREHIKKLWPELTRRNRRTRGSLLVLPHAYTVPGGRFGEQYYWDMYFIMLGLAADDEWNQINGIMKNYRYMLRKYGFIPTANRSYYLSRSQPPFFVEMVKLVANKQGNQVYLENLPYLLIEYRWWMKGRSRLSAQEHRAYARVVEMPDRSLLNRYYDNKTTPRPESLREDVETAAEAEGREASRLYLHLRAGAESGWDFSSRWLLDPHDLRTIHTADIVPVDLNCLLYEIEMTIAHTYEIMKNTLLMRKFHRLAERRKFAINKYCWNSTNGAYSDYNFHHFAATPHLTLATVFPLYVGIASQDQASSVARLIKRDFLKPGGLVTTLVENGQQWDSPNGWAPLQYIAVKGLRRYGFDALADEIRDRWLYTNDIIFARERKMVEKYNVISDSSAGGGEYPLQDGFGWTNGVYAIFYDEKFHKN